MAGAIPEIHLDNDHIATGTHKGATSATILNDPKADFKSCGIVTGVLIKNVSDGSSGEITDVSEDTITVASLSGGALNTWTAGDTYKIYITSTYNSEISRIYTDMRHSRKVTNPDQLNEWGVFPEDKDLDEDNEDIFGEGQPEPH